MASVQFPCVTPGIERFPSDILRVLWKWGVRVCLNHECVGFVTKYFMKLFISNSVEVLIQFKEEHQEHLAKIAVNIWCMSDWILT